MTPMQHTLADLHAALNELAAPEGETVGERIVALARQRDKASAERDSLVRGLQKYVVHLFDDSLHIQLSGSISGPYPPGLPALLRVLGESERDNS